MSLVLQKLLTSRKRTPQVGAISLFSLAGLVIGLSTQPSVGAQDPRLTESQSSQQQPAQAKMLKAKVGQGAGNTYLVAHPTWRESKATLTLDPQHPEWAVEHTLFSQVVVGVENEKKLKSALIALSNATGIAKFSYRSYLNESGVYVVETHSVENAIELADEITKLAGVEWAEVAHQRNIENKAITTDPSSVNQWHVLNPYGAFAGNDHALSPVYDTGITGAGVVVGILEAGGNSFFHVPLGGDPAVPADRIIHPDLANQLNFGLSMPTEIFDTGYSHGVSVAGIVAAEGDNGLAGSGVAYGAQLASLRNGNAVITGESFAHELNGIDIVNSSWGPDNEQFPVSNIGRFLQALPSNFEITIPQVTHAGVSRAERIGLDRGIRLGRLNKGRIFVFSAGNGSHFTGFPRLALGNAISLPGIGAIDAAPAYGYLDITGMDPADTTPADGIPDSFVLNGSLNLTDRYSGVIGDRVAYNEIAAMERTFAIASIGMSNLPSGYSTTGSAVFAGAYSQDTTLNTEFTPAVPTQDDAGWFDATFGLGISTLEQHNMPDSDTNPTDGSPFDCNVDAAAGLSIINPHINPNTEACVFNGTSAAAPVASGIIALMLEANPLLTIRDIQHIIQQTSTIVGYDPTNSYWTSVILGLGELDDDDATPPVPTFWSTNSAGIRHSDQYGFGIMNAEAAVTAASTWRGLRKPILLDSGVVNEGDPQYNQAIEIPEATFVQTFPDPANNRNINVLVPGARQSINLSCVRENFIVEGIEVTLSFAGVGVGDLLIALQSPTGTISPLALPRGDDGQYINYTFTTYKHWGEFSGGDWNLIVQDFRPAEDSPEGTPRANPFDPADLGLEEVTYLGPFGMPGNPNHTTFTLNNFRLKIYSTDQGHPVYEGCNPNQTSCPGDLDGNGIIEVADLRIFINWFFTGDPRADMNGDGNITFDDVGAFQLVWIPGFCNSTNTPFSIIRPVSGGISVRPIGAVN